MSNRKRGLIVEHDPTKRLRLTNQLNDEYDLEYATNRQAAVNMLQDPDNDYDMTVVDVQIPSEYGEAPSSKDGFAVIKAFNHRNENGAVVAISGALDSATRQQAGELNAALLEKSVSSNRLKRYLNNNVQHQAYRCKVAARTAV